MAGKLKHKINVVFAEIWTKKAGFGGLAKFKIELEKYDCARRYGILDEEYWKYHKLTDEQAKLITAVSRKIESKQ